MVTCLGSGVPENIADPFFMEQQDHYYLLILFAYLISKFSSSHHIRCSLSMIVKE